MKTAMDYPFESRWAGVFLLLVVFVSLALLAPVACGGGGGDDDDDSSSTDDDDDDDDDGSVTPYTWDLPDHFPPPVVPDDNPMTVEKVELGRYIFYDPRLSANGTMGCFSCHDQSKGFSDGLPVAVGSTGMHHPRNAQSLVNVGYYSTLTWGNIILTDLESQALGPMFGESPIELGITGHEDEVLNRFKDDEMYQEMFADAYPDEDDPVTFPNLIAAATSFVRTLISWNSPYDRAVYTGEPEAMSDSARRGMDLFFSEKLECHHCHGTFNLTDSVRLPTTEFVEKPFHNVGLYNVDGEGSYPAGNQGLYEVTSDPKDKGRFRAPTLRNVEVSAPYMHDGSLATLEDVMHFYEEGGRNVTEGPNAGDGRANPLKDGFITGFSITDQEREDVINFLKSLTDEDFLTNPDFSNPFEEDE